jgi:Protein of unknown function (DUF1778)
MRSLRLDPDLDEKVQRAAAISGESVSEFIRHAAEERANETLGAQPGGSFADVAGVVHGGGGRARRSGEAFAAGLARDRAAR